MCSEQLRPWLNTSHTYPCNAHSNVRWCRWFFCSLCTLLWRKGLDTIYKRSGETTSIVLMSINQWQECNVCICARESSGEERKINKIATHPISYGSTCMNARSTAYIWRWSSSRVFHFHRWTDRVDKVRWMRFKITPDEDNGNCLFLSTFPNPDLMKPYSKIRSRFLVIRNW